ncbi:MAG TPA: hypothetical protein VN812_16285 [Candidatus Acidoferrales bacterium]|nr:hypothetical protein [Candidatus Acidoferrales bacterium]
MLAKYPPDEYDSTRREGTDNVDQGVGAPAQANGSARILSTSSKVICTAFVSDTNNSLPTSMVYLTMVAKAKQKGE